MAKKKAPKKSAAKAKKAAKRPAKKAARAKARKPARARAAAREEQTEVTAGPPKLTGPSVVHWEVQARDPAAQQQFFGELFGWNVDANNPQNYGMVGPTGPKSIGGGIGGTTDAPRATFYVQVPDINASLAKAESLGAQTVMARMDIGVVIMAQFRDPEGNIIGLIEG